ncbi:APC family permease [Weissella confusa]|uniref:APC family permease n=1 Tax=Weissella confusa TaxID=1583 RepID=UPI00107F6928|nr:amino acid permease [Weissella confusa]MBD1490714.1 amino acid permease [Weissella confusa]MBD5833346.1 amino acid transporter [Weissella confusa]MBF7058551.1 amino acid permease [Weissella confusa]MBJ7621222.1 amino acid permease [Weissella confusa]MBJ7630595.1 amino acid permease [Weissella confusa]
MKKFKKGIGFPSVVLLGINGVIGGGLFLLPSTMYKQGGQYVLLAIALAGISATLIAMHYAVMSSRIDEDGGAWVYTKRAFGHYPGFLVGWFGWLFGVITISAETAAFLKTLTGLVPAVGTPLVYNSLAIGIMLLLGIMNYFGTGIASRIDDASSLIKIGVILAVFIATVVWLLLGSTSQFSIAQAKPVHDFSGAFGNAFYMFTGFSLIPIAAKEMKNPGKMLPRAILTVMLATTAIFVLMQVVAMTVLGDHLAGSALPVADIFNVILGRVGRTIIITGMMLSIIGVAIATSFNSPIELASMARERGFLPREFSRLNRYGAPVGAILLTIAISGGLILSGSYLFLIKLIVLSDFVQYLGTIFSSIKLRGDATLPTGYKLPGGKWMTYLTIVVVAYLFTTFAITTVLVGIGFAILGTIIYSVEQRRH